MFGLPIGYTPYFRHPAPGVKRQSGFLTPTFGSSSEIGLVASVPYHFVLDESSDFTLAPIFTQKAGTVLTGEYRRLHRNGYTQLGGGGTYANFGDNESKDRGEQFRGYLKSYGNYGVSDHSTAGFNVFLASDNTFLERYQISASSVLRNRAYLEGSEQRNFWSINGYYFQGLRPFDDQDTIPVALPLAETRLVSDRLQVGLVLHRRQQYPGPDTQQGPRYPADLEFGRLDAALSRPDRRRVPT